ncbi:MAG TPA: hypothetical protein VG672_13025, partial [Bryobacteraceae bacterium]|nr:hypothetical protein [Bryobacteraceae bacterium]
MPRSKLSAGLYLLVVFLSGALVGGFGYRLYTMNSVSASSASRPKPEDFRRRYLEEMRSRLKLDDRQVTRLSQIWDETKDRYRALHERTKPQLDAIKAQEKEIQAQHRQDVRTVLTDTQRGE